MGTKPLTEAQIAALPFDPRKVGDNTQGMGIDLAKVDVDKLDLSKAVIGWRTWNVKTTIPAYGICPKLGSATHTFEWPTGKASIADCPRCDPEDRPGESCGCGFYSAKSLKHLLGMGYVHEGGAYSGGQVSVVGKLACWGKVIEGGQGWRTSHAYPVQLYVPYEASHLARPLAKGYRVKVALANYAKLREEANRVPS